MTTKNIVFPYWENRARGYEDISALILVLEIICMIYPVAWLLKKCYGFWKRRKEIRREFFGKCKELWKMVFPVLKKTVKTDKLVNKKQ